jgi:hypothetical protein
MKTHVSCMHQQDLRQGGRKAALAIPKVLKEKDFRVIEMGKDKNISLRRELL